MFFKRNPIKVSVILPVYNDELYIEQCMGNLVNQTLKEIEIICIDDGSTDESYKLMKKFSRRDGRIHIIRQENKGAGAARNKGLEIACGEYLYFPDSDDIPSVDLLEKTYDEAIRTEADVVAFKSERLDINTNALEKCNFSLYLDKLPDYRPFSISDIDGNFFRFFMGWAWDKIFRRSFIADNGLMFQEQRTTNDMYFVYMSLIKANHISTLDECLYIQRINNINSLSMTRDLSWDGFYKALLKLRNVIVDDSKLIRYLDSYTDYALHSCLANVNALSDKNSLLLKNKLINEWFKELGILDAPAEWFTSQVEFQQYKDLVKD